MSQWSRDAVGQDPVVVRRRLCRHLVQLRGELTQQAVARSLGWSRSKVIRIENGSIGISTADVRALLALYGVATPALTDMLASMAKQSRQPTASPYRDVLAPEMAFYLRFESSASAIRQYHPHLVPGLLQTEEYAGALIRALADEDTPPAVIERQVEARMSRQATLRDAGRVRAQFVLDESALRRGIATGPDVMRRQLAHIVALDQQPHFSVRVLTFGASLRRGAQWPFVLLDFAGDDGDTLLYLEGRDTRVTRDDPDEIARHQVAFAELSAAATPVSELVPSSGELLPAS